MHSFLDLDNIRCSSANVEYHPLRPFVNVDTRVLFLGSFPPQRKRWCVDFFYPNYINDHWRIQGLVFYDDKNHFVDEKQKTFKLDSIVQHCLSYGIGFYDTAVAVRRLADNASDKFLEVVQPSDINHLVSMAQHLRAIVTTGTKATETLCDYLGIENLPKVGNKVETPLTSAGHVVMLYRMPSSSRAYPLSLEKKADAYREMFLNTGLLR